MNWTIVTRVLRSLACRGAAIVGVLAAASCEPGANQFLPGFGGSREPVWSKAFDASGVGVLTSVWGSGPDDVWVVGGTAETGQVFHFDGSAWQQLRVPRVGLLAWVYGFSQNDVYAVGEGGDLIHYNGEAWLKIESGTRTDLWGIWGNSPDDFWIVGGDPDATFGGPLVLHYTGAEFLQLSPPVTDRVAPVLYGVWGVGARVYAVGANGLIVEYDGLQWRQAATGSAANEDFLSIWGTSESNIVTVGGRSGARITTFDGESWTTRLTSGVPALNGVYMVKPDQAILGGAIGYVGDFVPSSGELESEDSGETQTIFSIWGDGTGRFYAVGGETAETAYSGLALVRTLGEPDFEVLPPEPPPVPNTTLVLGVSNGLPFRAMTDGEDMQLFSFGQGGMHVFLSYRATGFPPNAEVDITVSATRVEDDLIAVNQVTQRDTMTEIEPGLNQRLDRLVRMELFPSEVVGRNILLNVTIESVDDPGTYATGSLEMHLLQPQ